SLIGCQFVVCVTVVAPGTHLPHKQACPATARTDTPGLARATAGRSHRTLEMRFRGAKLLKLNCGVSVHDFSGRVHFLVRTGGENDNSSVPDPFDVSFRIRFGGPDRPKLADQVHLKIGVWDTHHPSARHIRRLPQDADIIPWETTGLEIVNNSIDRFRILKQTNCRSCHVDLHQKIVFWNRKRRSARLLINEPEMCSVPIFELHLTSSTLCAGSLTNCALLNIPRCERSDGLKFHGSEIQMIDFLCDAEKLKPWRSVGQEFHSLCQSRPSGSRHTAGNLRS